MEYSTKLKPFNDKKNYQRTVRSESDIFPKKSILKKPKYNNESQNFMKQNTDPFEQLYNNAGVGGAHTTQSTFKKERENNLKQSKVSFKQQNEIIDVESFKKYNSPDLFCSNCDIF